MLIQKGILQKTKNKRENVWKIEIKEEKVEDRECVFLWEKRRKLKREIIEEIVTILPWAQNEEK